MYANVVYVAYCIMKPGQHLLFTTMGLLLLLCFPVSNVSLCPTLNSIFSNQYLILFQKDLSFFTLISYYICKEIILYYKYTELLYFQNNINKIEEK